MTNLTPIVYPLLNVIKSLFGAEYSHMSDADEPSSKKFTDRINNGLGLKFEGQIPAAEGFNAYATNRMKAVAHFSGVKAPDGKPINEALSKDTSEDTANAKILRALKLTQATTKAREIFHDEMAAIKAYVGKRTAHPHNVIHYLFGVKDAAERAIKTQQAAEKSNLTALFDDQLFTKSLNQNLVLNDDKDEIARIKNDMLAALEKSQTDELAAFNKSLNEPIKQILDIPTVQKTATLARYMENPETRNEINELIKQAGGKDARISAGGENRDLASEATDEQLKQLKTIRTRSGLKLHKQGENSFSLNLPHRILGNPLYYLSGQNNIKNDLKSLPEEIQRRGFKSITMNLSHGNQKYALKLAREAYAACRETGFDEKNIKIKVNGVLMTADKIFAGHGAMKQKIDLQAEQYKAERKKLISKSDTSIPDFKAKVMALKATEDKKTATDTTSLTTTTTTPTP